MPEVTAALPRARGFTLSADDEALVRDGSPTCAWGSNAPTRWTCWNGRRRRWAALTSGVDVRRRIDASPAAVLAVTVANAALAA
jgi:hypothetical protein